MKNDTKTLGIGYDIKTGDVEITAPDDVHEIPLDIVKTMMNTLSHQVVNTIAKEKIEELEDYKHQLFVWRLVAIITTCIMFAVMFWRYK